MEKLSKKDKNTIEKAIKICFRFNEDYAGYELTDIIDSDLRFEESANIPESMSEEDGDILSESINICDRIGKYGTGDLLLDVINKHMFFNED